MHIDSSKVERIIQSLQRGELIYMPTDTIPGLVARATDKSSVEKIYELKQRDLDKPPTVIIGLSAHIDELQLAVPESARRHLEEHWPGPVSFVLPHNERAAPVFKYLHRGRNSLAVRMTAETWLQEVIANVGPLATSSANVQSKPSAMSPAEAYSYFGDSIPLYVEHAAVASQPSKILVITDAGVEQIR